MNKKVNGRQLNKLNIDVAAPMVYVERNIEYDGNFGYVRKNYSMITKDENGFITLLDFHRHYSVDEIIAIYISKGYNFNFTYAEYQAFYWSQVVKHEQEMKSAYADWCAWIEEKKSFGLNVADDVFRPNNKEPELWTLYEYFDFFDIESVHEGEFSEEEQAFWDEIEVILENCCWNDDEEEVKHVC